MGKPQLMFFVSEKLHAIFPTIENGVVPLKDKCKVYLAIKKCRKRQLASSEIWNVYAHPEKLDMEPLWS